MSEQPDIDRLADTAEHLARAFHEAYERLAPTFGYETRKASAVPWEQVPAENRALMIAVVAEVVAPALDELVALAREMSVRPRNHAPWCTYEHEGGCPAENAPPPAHPVWKRAEAAEARVAELEERYDALAATIQGKTAFDVVAEKVDAEIRANRLEARVAELEAAIREERRWATGTPEHTAACDRMYALAGDGGGA